jgi:hypothetical protein
METRITVVLSCVLSCLFLQCVPNSQVINSAIIVAPNNENRTKIFKCIVLQKHVKSLASKKDFLEAAELTKKICKIFPQTVVKIQGTQGNEILVTWSPDKDFLITLNPNTGVGKKELKEEVENWLKSYKRKMRKKPVPVLTVKSPPPPSKKTIIVKTIFFTTAGLFFAGSVVTIYFARAPSPTRKEAEIKAVLDVIGGGLILSGTILIVGGVLLK